MTKKSVIAGCLDSVSAQNTGVPCDREPIVADNGSTDKTADVMARYPKIPNGA
jgi:glycosyltransferase involved in cell wall biosynthesis